MPIALVHNPNSNCIVGATRVSGTGDWFGSGRMTTTAELQRLLEASIKDFRAEPAFLRALLDAPLFVHTPKTEPPGRRQFVMFKSPIDGRHVIPVFTDQAKADWAAQGNVHVLEMNGRALFDLARGATFVLDPNDNWCTLYPEEIERLLCDGTVASVQQWAPDEHLDKRVYKLDRVPKLLTRGLGAVLPAIREIEIAYLAGVKDIKGNMPGTLIVALGGDPKLAERSIRTAATALYDVINRVHRLVDLTHFDPADPPAWIHHLDLKPVYHRQAVKPPPPRPGYN
jgi:hypothetical protein